jgi:hypothetical protein
MWIRRLSELLVATAVTFAAGPVRAEPPTSDDALADYRERFKQGMDLYKAGSVAEAVGHWAPIYAELGPQKGYRLAYDLGVAYEQLGDNTRAAEHLQSFLQQVDARRTQDEAQPAIVLKEESDARDRIAALTAAKGRIRVDPGSPPRAAQVDAMEPRLAVFVAWVNPGTHTVTFGPGGPAPESRSIEVHAGELVQVAPSSWPPATAGAPTALAPSPPPEPSARRQVTQGPAAAPPSSTVSPEPPFPSAVLFVAGGLTLAAGIAAVPLEVNAWSVRNRDTSEASVSTSDQASFYSARTWAYGAIGVAAGLAVVTAGLTTWYFVGRSGREVAITPGGLVGRF